MKQQLISEVEMNNHDYWDKLYSGDLQKLPWVSNPYPAELFQNFVNKLQGSDNILDYGTGIGRYYSLLRETGATITCLDISKNAVKICQKHNPDSIGIQSDSPIPLQEDFFNGVLCWGVLHHINPDTREKFWGALSDKIKSEGLILLGGWSEEDSEHKDQNRISSITLHPTWDIDTDLEKTIEQFNLKIIDKGHYPFLEAYTNKNRLFSFYLIQKT